MVRLSTDDLPVSGSASPGGRLLEPARLGSAWLALVGLMIATRFVELGHAVPRPINTDVGDASIIRIAGSRSASSPWGTLIIVVAVASVIAVFWFGCGMHRPVFPERSTARFVILSLLCLGGLSAPWIIGRAAWGRADVRSVGAILAACVASWGFGTVGPVTVGIDEWPVWRSSVVGGALMVCGLLLVLAITTIDRGAKA